MFALFTRQTAWSGLTDNSVEMKKTSVLILAAGLSTRMGKEKLTLEFSDGVTFLEQIVTQYHKFGCHKIVLVVNPRGKKILDHESLRVPGEVVIAVNAFPERGRFSSIKTGLMSLADEDFVFIQNIDNPDITVDLLSALRDNIKEADYTCPFYHGKGGHPVLISNKIVKAMINENTDDVNLKHFLSRYKKIETEVDDPTALLNINTAEEYQSWKTKN
jgi:molybdenum cofactor cytidylyltransferase